MSPERGEQGGIPPGEERGWKANPRTEAEDEQIRRMAELLRAGDFQPVIEFSKSLPQEVIASSEVQDMAKKAAIRWLPYTKVEMSKSLLEAFAISAEYFLEFEDAKEATKRGFVRFLYDGELDDAKQLLEAFPLSADVLESKEVREAVKTAVIGALKRHRALQVKGILDLVPFSADILGIKEVREWAMLEAVRSSAVESERLLEDFELSDEVRLGSETVQIVVKSEFNKHLYDGKFNDAKRLLNFSPLPDVDIRASVKDAIIHYLYRGEADTAMRLLVAFPIPADVLGSPELLTAAKEGVSRALSLGTLEDAKQILEAFPLPSEEVQAEVKEQVISSLSVAQIYRTKQILEAFPLPADVLGSPELLTAAREGVSRALSLGTLEFTKQILETFPLPFQEVCMLIDPNSDIQDQFFERGKLDLFEKLSSSISGLLLLAQYRERISDLFPFESRVVENPTMAGHLIEYYPKFDQETKETLREFFRVDEEVRATAGDPLGHPNEYRKAIQEKLLAFKRNEEILMALREGGIDTDAWLAPPAPIETTFERSGATPDDLLAGPVGRISGEYLSVYPDEAKAVLGDFSRQLKDVRIIEPGKTMAEIDAIPEVVQMRVALTAAEEAGDDKKAQGIRKGLENVSAKLSRNRETTLWEQITSELNRLSIQQKALIEAQTKLKSPKRSERKEGLGVIRDIQKLFTEGGFDPLAQYRSKIREVLGVDLTDAIYQEITTDLALKVDHLQSDLRAIASGLAELEQSEHPIDGHTLTVSTWSRNPDRDLYLGNETDCCIRIDAEYHGAESPITDYLTDLGMQVVTVRDETADRTAFAAWLYLGINARGEVGLVIDNIEGHSDYNRYRAQVERELRAYIETYRERIHGGLLAQGPHNNDAVVAELSENFMKLGGYNKPDGYYLEAEPSDDGGEEWEDEDYDEDAPGTQDIEPNTEAGDIDSGEADSELDEEELQADLRRRRSRYRSS